jgi:Tol biopolymer transport system component
MTQRGILFALALVALAGGAGCASGAHKSSPTPNSSLRGKIVFRRFLDEAHRHGVLFVMNADGTGVRQITHPPADAADSLNGPPSATPDGSTLIFDRSTSNAAGIFRIGIDGRGEREVRAPSGVPGDGWPVVSPDGHRIAVARAWGHQDEFEDLKTGLYVLGIDGAHPRRVADFGYRADVGGATWSPDGNTIVLSAHNNGAGKPADGSALFAVRVRGGGLRRLTPWETDRQISGPAFSPDGKAILFRLKPSGQDFGGDYWTMRSDGTARRRLTHFGPGHATASAMWSPDGSMIVFADSGIGGNDDLYVMRADGGGVRRLTRTPRWESAAVWLRQ